MSQSEDSGNNMFDGNGEPRRTLQNLFDELIQCSEFSFVCYWRLVHAHAPPGDANRDSAVALQVIASAGKPRRAKKTQRRDREQPSSDQFPGDLQQIGEIAKSGEPLVIPKIKREGNALLQPDWVAEEQIRGFFAYPVRVNHELRGVLAVCSRAPLNESLVGLLMTVTRSVAGIVELADHHCQLKLENQLLRLATWASSVPVMAQGATPAARKLEAQIQLAARYEDPVLITGGSGAVSRDVARQIHLARPQHSGILIPVEGKRFCEQMLPVDGELLQRFQGTLLLENIDLIPFEQQKSLAQFLASTQGTSLTGNCGAKILASITQKNPETSADELQHDLRCLLSVLTVEIPPLNERPNDLQDLAIRFLNELQLRHGRSGLTLDAEELERMQQYPWPGNDRELEFALERAVLRLPATETVVRHVLGTSPFSLTTEPQGGIASEDQVKEWQRENLIACLEQCHWKVYGHDGAAAQAGIKPTTFISRMKKFGIVRRQNKGK